MCVRIDFLPLLLQMAAVLESACSLSTHTFSSCSIGPGDLDLEQDAHLLQRYTFGNVLWHIVNARQSELFGLLPVLFGSKSP